MKRAVHPRLGSALGLSQPLSGFLATPGLRGLVSCRNRSWDLPSECSPRKDRQRLSTPTCSPAVIHPPAVAHCLRLITAGFADAHAFARLPGSPSDYELPFHMPEGTLPGHSGLKQRNRPLQRASPTSELCSPHESVRNRLGLPLTDGRYSPGFFPSRVFSDCVSKPQTHPSHEDSNTRLSSKPQGACDSSSRPKGLPRPRRTSSTPPTG